MLKVEATAERNFLPRATAASRHMPVIVWRSPGARNPSSSPRSSRLHLVETPPFDRAAHQRRKRFDVRSRVVESAYLAAALGTAVVIWWSART